MKKILIISGDYPPIRSGEANLAFYLAEKLSERGIDVEVLAVRGSEDSPHLKVHPLMNNWSWRELGHLRSVIKQSRPDAVLLMYHRGMYHGHPMISFAATLAKSIDPNIRFMTQVSQVNFSTKRGSRFATRLARRFASMWAGSDRSDYVYGTLLRDSDCVMVLSQAHGEFLSRLDKQAEQKTLLIPPPPILSIADDPGGARRTGRERLGIADDEFLISFYGFIYRNKGIQYLLEAAARLRGEGRRVRVAIIGGVLRFEHLPDRTADSEAYLQSLQAICRSENLDGVVHWTGTTPIGSEIPSTLIYASDAVALPFDEGVRLNNSSFGATAAHRMPIVTTRSDATEAAFKNQENVLLCQPHSSGELAAALRRLMDEPQLRDELCRGAAKMADEWFSWDRSLDQITAALGLGDYNAVEHHLELSAKQ